MQLTHVTSDTRDAHGRANSTRPLPGGSAARAACRMGTCKNSDIQIVVEESAKTGQTAGKWKDNKHWISVWTLFRGSLETI
jgi:hypothetical protein